VWSKRKPFLEQLNLWIYQTSQSPLMRPLYGAALASLTDGIVAFRTRHEPFVAILCRSCHENNLGRCHRIDWDGQYMSIPLMSTLLLPEFAWYWRRNSKVRLNHSKCTKTQFQKEISFWGMRHGRLARLHTSGEGRPVLSSSSTPLTFGQWLLDSSIVHRFRPTF